MSGYIHTCGNCGAHMQVHERYLGRTLKCTSCRTSFEAVLPEGAEADEPELPAVDEGEVTPGIRRYMPWLLLLLVPLVGIIWFLGQDQSEGPASAVFQNRPSAGENGRPGPSHTI